MGLSDWIGRRIRNWTTKPFPEGMPVLIPRNGNEAKSPSTNQTPSALMENTKTVSPPSLSSEAASPAVPNESAEEIAEKIMILIPYIKQYRSQGMMDEEIAAFLMEHAWPEYIVKRAIKNA